MKNFFLISLVSLSLFSAACTKQVGSPQRQAEISSKITGYEQQLKTYASSVKEFSSQAQDIQSMDPAVMFAFAHSLVVSGDYDQAVFWYYLGQFRAIVLYNSVSTDMVIDNDYFSKAYTESGLAGMPYIIGTVSKQMLYRSIMQTFGISITQIGIKNTKNTAEFICAALNYENKHPFNVAKAASGAETANVLAINAQKKRVKKALLEFVKDLQQGTLGKKQYLK